MTTTDLAAATAAVNDACTAFVYTATSTPAERAKRADVFRAALLHLRAINGGAAIHLDPPQ